MKKLHITLILTALCAITLGGCKANRSAYKAAYESAVAKRDSTGGVEGTIYNRYREMGRSQQIVLGTDTLPVVTEYIGYTEGGGSSRENVERYNVVVGRFKQKFNARKMRERLMDHGYPGAMVVHTREPLYYVISHTCSTAQEALEELRRVESDTLFTLKAPLPFVLQPAHKAR